MTYLHGEAECSAEVSDEEKLHEIVHSTVDPPTSLTEKNAERIWDYSLANRLRNEDLFSMGESLQHQRRQVSIFSQQQQILLVQGIDDIFLISRNDIWICKDRHEIPFRPLRCFDSYCVSCGDITGRTVHTEAPRKTGDTTKDGLESFGEMVRDVILENLNHRNPTSLFVCDLGLSAQPHYIIIFDHRSNHKRHRVREDLCIGINLLLTKINPCITINIRS